jgi:LacI family transcriptional regulator
MRVDKINMGRIAVQLLAQRLEFADSAAMTVMLQPELIERQSVRRCEQLRMKGSAKKKAEEGG